MAKMTQDEWLIAEEAAKLRAFYRDVAGIKLNITRATDIDGIIERCVGWSCPWATHQHINGNGVRCSWSMTRYVTQHG